MLFLDPKFSQKVANSTDYPPGVRQKNVRMDRHVILFSKTIFANRHSYHFFDFLGLRNVLT